MEQSTGDQKAVKGTNRGRVLRFKARKVGAKKADSMTLGRVVPFAGLGRKSRPQPEPDQVEKKVRELKARVKKGQYQVETVRLAEKMIREALLENLSTARRKGSSGAVR